jgi:hypothetical protein
MRGKLLVFSLLAVLSNAVHAGEILRCIAANGDVMFTNMACPANSQMQHVSNYEPVPDSPTPAYSAPSGSVAIVNAAQADAAQARAAYQAGYQQAQAEAQREQSSSESEYAPAWIPFFPTHNSRSHSHHPHPRQTMTARAPHAPDVMLTRHR